MSSFKPVTHVLFDMDGLLLDTERLYTVATQEVSNMYHGIEYTWEVKSSLMGNNDVDATKVIIEALKLPLTYEEYREKIKAIYARIFPTCPLLPGAERLIRHLKASSVPIALATSSSQESYDLKTTSHKPLFDLFDHITVGSDPQLAHGKPHPDIFLISMAKFKDQPKAEQCLVFEDSHNGVLAGRAAGMQVVMVPDPRMSQEMRKEATIVLDSLENFKPELFGLPPFPQ